MACKGYQEIRRKDGTRRSWRIWVADPKGGHFAKMLPGTIPEAKVQRSVAATRTNLDPLIQRAQNGHKLMLAYINAEIKENECENRSLPPIGR